jgi:hypothetical protein
MTKLNRSGLKESPCPIPVFIHIFSDKIPLDFIVVKVNCPSLLYNFKQNSDVMTILFNY